MFISGLLCVWEDARGPIDPNPALNIYLFPPPPPSLPLREIQAYSLIDFSHLALI